MMSVFRHYERMASESGSVGGSLGMLCMTLCFIYVVFFGVHGDQLEQDLAALPTSASFSGTSLFLQNRVVLPDASREVEEDIPTYVEILPTAEERAPEIDEIDRGPTRFDTPGRDFYSVQELFAQQNVGEAATLQEALVQPDVISLSGTWQWEGIAKSLVTVGLGDKGKYILKNMDNTHFIHLVDFSRDIMPTIRALGGNIVEIAEKNSIKENQLFGDKIWFINLPEYKNIKVLMIVHFSEKNDTWFLQIDHETYYAKKKELAALFAPWYTW